jgi:hypothetical protein
MADTPFVQSPAMTAIAVMYRNDELIADAVMPRIPVGLPTFEYSTFPIGTAFTVPDTRVGRMGRPPQYVPTSDKLSAATLMYGLDIPVPRRDTRLAAAMRQAFPASAGSQDPLALAAALCTSLVLLDREIRVANLLTTLGTYPAAQRVTLSGAAQWSDYVNSNPIAAILGAMDLMPVRPNVGVIGQQAWTVVRQHPRVVSAILGNAGTSGVVTRQALADVLGLREIRVGAAWLNTARPGQAATLARAWGRHMSLLHLSADAGPDGPPSFGWTGQWGQRFGGTITDPNIGLEGGDLVRVGEELVELVTAPNAGYFFQNVTA